MVASVHAVQSDEPGAARRPPIFRDGMLEDRIALITGGSSGIGLGIARVFAELGATIVIVGRREDKLAAAKQQLTHGVPGTEPVTTGGGA